MKQMQLLCRNVKKLPKIAIEKVSCMTFDRLTKSLKRLKYQGFLYYKLLSLPKVDSVITDKIPLHIHYDIAY